MVHRVLGREEDTHAGPESGGKAERQRERVAGERVLPQLLAEHGNLSERRADDPVLQIRMTVQDEAEHG